MPRQTNPESVVREIKRKTRRRYSSEEKIRIVLEGLRGEETLDAFRRDSYLQLELGRFF